MKVIVADQVRNFLLSEKNYLQRHSSTAHLRFAQRFRETARLLVLYPHAGAERSLPIAGLTSFVVGAYVIDYEVSGDQVCILNMRHGRQQDPYLPIDDDQDFEA